MVAFMNYSLGGAWRVACGGMLFAGVLSCAVGTRVPAPSMRTAEELLANVRVDRDGDSTLITLMGLHDPVYTAYQENEPLQLVIDLPSVLPEGFSEPVIVHDGLIEEIAVSPIPTGSGGAMTRLEIGLSSAVVYEVVPRDEGLVIRVDPAHAGDPWERAASTGDWVIGGEDGVEPLRPAVAPGPATKLLAIDVQDTGDGTLLLLRADGAVPSAESFVLKKPARLVIDLPGLTNHVPISRIDVGTAHAARVRLGQHPDKVRVVIDAGKASRPFDGRRLVPAGHTLLVSLGSGDALSEALADAMGAVERSEPRRAPELELEPDSAFDFGVIDKISSALADAFSFENPFDVAPVDQPVAGREEPVVSGSRGGGWHNRGVLPPATATTAHVYGVQFDAESSRDRIAIVSDEPLEYRVIEWDAETVILSLYDAMIDPDAAVRVQPEPIGPVALLTAFQQPDVDVPEVRVVVRRAPNLKPNVLRRGSLIFMDFENTGAVASLPPVYELPGEVVELTGAAGLTLEGPESPEPVESAPEEPDLIAEDSPIDPSDFPEELRIEDSPIAAPTPAQPMMLAQAASPDPMQPLAPTLAAVASPSSLSPAPAALEPRAAVDILREGGLIDGKEYVGRRISLDFKEVDIADVMRLIADVSELNIIAGDEVQGKVTIRLMDVPWDQALDVVLLTKGLAFVRVGNVLRIAPSDVLKQEEELRLQERRAKEKLEDLVVKLQPVNYANVQEISKMVQRLLSARGTVNVDTRTNTLIIKDIASVVDEATALILALDTETPQVLIEAKIVEANLDFSRELGSIWSVDTLDTIGGPGDLTFLPGPIVPDNNNLVFANPITQLATASFEIGALLLNDKFNVELQIQAAEIEGEGKVISSPRIITLDNREAKIEQGVSIPFQTFESGDAQLEFIDALLSLVVTPHITADRSIIMKISITRDAPDDSVPTPTGSPAIAKNQAQTETLVKDGQTLVIGGIYVVTKSERASRVPWLHKIPFLGAAFRSHEYRDIRKELLIFVTPRIVDPVGSSG